MTFYCRKNGKIIGQINAKTGTAGKHLCRSKLNSATH